MLTPRRSSARRRRTPRRARSRPGWRPRRRATCPRSTGSNPASATSASSVGRLESRIWPGRERRRALDQLVAGGQHADPGPRERPHLGHAELSQHAEVGGRELVAGRQHLLAGLRSSPAARRWLPGSTATSMRTARPPSSRSVRSTMTTASAPAGIGAPVMMRTASPAPSDRSAGLPGRQRRPPRGSVTGAPAVSAARTAKPSMAVLANGGTASVDDHVVGQHETRRLGQRDGHRGERLAPVEHVGAGVVEADHDRHPTGRSDDAPTLDDLGQERRNSGPRSSRSRASSTVARR